MNNEPVAWMITNRVISSVPMEGAIPLYTHPVKEDEGKVCARCGAIAYDPVITQTVKELTDEEIAKYVKEWELKELKENSSSTNYVQELAFIDGLTWLLRKAQKK